MEVAEDIVADAFGKLFDNRMKINDAAHIFGYLFVIARNQAIGYRREQKRQREADEAQERLVEKGYIDPIGTETEKEQVMEKINGLIGQLPAARKRIFRMYFFDGLDIRTIANLQNLTETTVRNQKNRALIFLRKALAL
jgi:RNA polymerase sigma-70 factor (ECF subfamily)